MKEIWKDINGYENLYQVSNYGRVKSNYYKDSEKIIKQNYSKKTRRFYVDLYLNKKRKHKSVHRIVAEAFVKNPYNYPIVNHIDGNPTNNNANNLEWCTPSYNSKHAYHIGLCKKRKEINEKTKIPIIRSDGKIYESIRAAALDMKIGVEGVRGCLKGRRIRCKGYRFFYLSEYTNVN